MKRLIPTLLLVIICIGGFWYASSKDFFKETKEPAAALVKVNKDEVASYSIKSGEGEIELQRKDGKWTMSKPSPLPLNDYSSDSWVESFNSLSKGKTVDANAADLAQFGLDKPSQQFKVTLSSGESHTVSVGAPVAIQGFNYAMVSGSPEVFQLSDAQTKSLAKQPIDFMETSPLKFDPNQVRNVNIDWKGQKWTFSKTDADKKAYESDWKLGDQAIKAADAGPYLDKLQFLSTQQLARPAGEIKTDGPELRIELKTADASNKEATAVYLGKVQQDNVWIVKEGGAWAYALPIDSIQELADKFKQLPEAAAPAGEQAAPTQQPGTPVPQPGSSAPASPAPAAPTPASPVPAAPAQPQSGAAVPPELQTPAPASPAPAAPAQPQSGGATVPPQLQTPAAPAPATPQSQAQPK